VTKIFDIVAKIVLFILFVLIAIGGISFVVFGSIFLFKISLWLGWALVFTVSVFAYSFHRGIL